MNDHPYEYILEGCTIASLTYTDILRHSSALAATDKRSNSDIQPQSIAINSGAFTNLSSIIEFPTVTVSQRDNSLILLCGCKTPKNKLCEHQGQVLQNIMERANFRIFFDKKLRHDKIRQVAKDYGLENENDPDEFFEVEYKNQSVEITPKLKELFPVTQASKTYLQEKLIPLNKLVLPKITDEANKLIVVFGKHRYYEHFVIDLFEVQTGKDGKPKNPLKPLNPLDFIWKTDKADELKFYTGISKFQNIYDKSDADIDGLKALVKNPLNVAFYYHNNKAADKITASSLVPVELKMLHMDVNLSVDFKEKFHEVTGQLTINDKAYALKDLNIRFDYFVLVDAVMYLIDDPDLLRVIEFFKQNNHKILIHHSQFEEFRQNVLAKLENKVKVSYSYIRQATKMQIEEQGFDREYEKLIYLSDSDDYVLITPVMRYGTIEVPVLSRKQIYATDQNGNAFTLERDANTEDRFTGAILRQHPNFSEQLNQQSFYLHKERFLEEAWFLNAIDEWTNQQITVLGFNELKNNKLNQYKAKVSVSVGTSGIEWFETTLDVKFGKQKASLNSLHKSLRNKSKFVQLGDGTMGILPEEWLERFAQYFESGEIHKETIRTPKSNFADIARLYEEEVLTQEVKNQLAFYNEAFADFEEIQEVEVPAALNTTLRDYQKQGLNWLNFLDEFGFGGCLADDMGLGKTIQVIAFILSQREKQKHNTNLVVVPTSLVFNWQSELEKFAPSIKVLNASGANRNKEIVDFDQYEVIITTYGTLLSDITYLKQYRFNYIFLDESQAIKNTESQRYKAVRMLQSRNKIVLTGTPVENNMFDLYGQLSFACPGLLGSKQQFNGHYFIPINKFNDTRRAKELQQKINPFILRRTKKQVATELPDKTEMVIYCEMGDEQRKVYDAYEREFRDYIANQNEQQLTKESIYVLKGLTKLRQVCNSPAILGEEEYYGNASSKIDVLMEQIESKSPQHKILVFSQFVTMLDLIRKELEQRGIAFEYLTGQTQDREAKVDNFQHNDQVRVFLISLKAGGTGLNLTQADYVYLVDPWWNPAVENQAIDRSYRIGQKKNVVAVRLICPGTIEEKIMQLQASKKELANDLIKTDSAALKALSKKDLMGLLA